MSEGDTLSASAMLSNPSLDESGGSSDGDVHVEREQVADGVRVLGAVQPMQCRRIEPGAGHGGGIKTRFEVGRQRVERGALGTPCARRRHHARPDLHDDFFPGCRIAGHLIQVQGVEREARRFRAARCDR